MTKIINPGGRGNLQFWCPGCGMPHSVSTNPETARANPNGSRPLWTWNGDSERPTFAPSVNYPGYCHFYVEDGKIRFLEALHVLANTTVDLPEWPESQNSLKDLE